MLLKSSISDWRDSSQNDETDLKLKRLISECGDLSQAKESFRTVETYPRLKTHIPDCRDLSQAEDLHSGL